MVNHFMDDLFRFSDAKHANIITGVHSTSAPITKSASRWRTPPGWCIFLATERIFKQETGVTFNETSTACV
ncbi:MAG: hypothetical protein ACLRRT_14255 [Ruthenibacterium lactatiformans]